MNKIDECIKKMKAFTKEISGNKEKSRKFLVEAGIYTSSGDLSNNYR